jgi:hypothetical protein
MEERARLLVLQSEIKQAAYACDNQRDTGYPHGGR